MEDIEKAIQADGMTYRSYNVSGPEAVFKYLEEKLVDTGQKYFSKK